MIRNNYESVLCIQPRYDKQPNIYIIKLSLSAPSSVVSLRLYMFNLPMQDRQTNTHQKGLQTPFFRLVFTVSSFPEIEKRNRLYPLKKHFSPILLLHILRVFQKQRKKETKNPILSSRSSIIASFVLFYLICMFDRAISGSKKKWGPSIFSIKKGIRRSIPASSENVDQLSSSAFRENVSERDRNTTRTDRQPRSFTSSLTPHSPLPHSLPSPHSPYPRSRFAKGSFDT